MANSRCSLVCAKPFLGQENNASCPKRAFCPPKQGHPHGQERPLQKTSRCGTLCPELHYLVHCDYQTRDLPRAPWGTSYTLGSPWCGDFLSVLPVIKDRPLFAFAKGIWPVIFLLWDRLGYPALLLWPLVRLLARREINLPRLSLWCPAPERRASTDAIAGCGQLQH